jgi:SAM-dependent methyltransferase
MDDATFAVEAAVEQEHWWFRGRRELFASEIRSLPLLPASAILDVGTGTGANLRMLRDNGYSNIRGLDASPVAVKFCAEKGLGTTSLGDMLAMPFEANSFDLTLATDVIEHVDDDLAALREIGRVTKPGGFVLITVPAFPSLWGLQDKVAHHKRRYRMRPLLDRVREAGLDPRRHFHFNYFLFFPIWVARQILRLTRPQLRSENEVNSPMLNRILFAIFSLDVRSAPVIRSPLGVSIFVLARKPQT